MSATLADAPTLLVVGNGGGRGAANMKSCSVTDSPASADPMDFRDPSGGG
jgi:hypothetical protein